MTDFKIWCDAAGKSFSGEGWGGGGSTAGARGRVARLTVAVQSGQVVGSGQIVKSLTERVKTLTRELILTLTTCQDYL